MLSKLSILMLWLMALRSIIVQEVNIQILILYLLLTDILLLSKKIINVFLSLIVFLL